MMFRLVLSGILMLLGISIIYVISISISDHFTGEVSRYSMGDIKWRIGEGGCTRRCFGGGYWSGGRVDRLMSYEEMECFEGCMAGIDTGSQNNIDKENE